jgi:hypothetical protein
MNLKIIFHRVDLFKLFDQPEEFWLGFIPGLDTWLNQFVIDKKLQIPLHSFPIHIELVRQIANP